MENQVAQEPKFCNICSTQKLSTDFYKGLTYCKSCHKIKRDLYYINNKSSKIQYASDYRKSNLDKVKNTVNNYYKARRKTDVLFNLKESLRGRIYHGLKSYLKEGKSTNSTQLLGCDMKTWKSHLESLFTPEMNWDNYGKNKYWEIDHIMPVDSFDLTQEENQKSCFHYTNTQPLTILQNQQKSNKIYK